MLWCAYYLHGKEYRQSTGTSDPKEAEKFLRRKLKEVGAAQINVRTFITPVQEKVKVSALLDALQTSFKIDQKDSPQFLSHLKRIRAAFGHFHAAELADGDAIDRYIEKQQERGMAPATINRGTQILGQAFRLAVEKKKLCSMPLIRHLSEKGNTRQGFFAEREFRSVMENLPAYLQDFALFSFLVGWRSGEVKSLLWEDVDGDCIRLRGENSKNGDGRVIVLEGELADLMERRKAARLVKTDTGTVLASVIFHRDGLPIGDIRKAWATACKLAGCPGRLFHDLRRTSVRNMIRAGVSEKVAMTVSGHKSHSMLTRYNIVSETDQRQALRLTQNYLKDTIEQTKVVPLSARVQ